MKPKSTPTLPSPKKKPAPVKKAFQCEICQRIFQTKRNLQSHMAVHSDSRPYKCASCDKTYKFESNLNEHQNIHSGEKFQCELCNKQFTLKYCLKRHLLRHSNGKKPFACNVCNKSYWQRSDFNSHMKYAHDSINSLKHECIFCKKAFRGERDLHRHVIGHIQERPYFCKFCFMETSTMCVLKRHLTTHKPDRPRDFQCDLCKKAFLTKSELTTHIRTHLDETSYTCDVCKKGFRTRSSLFAHMLVHKDDRPFQCEKCSLAFQSKARLKQHQKLHEDTKRHPCPFCPMDFKLESYLVELQAREVLIKKHAMESLSLRCKLEPLINYS